MFNAQFSMLNVQFKRLFSLKELLIINCSLLIFSSCSIQQKISKSAQRVIRDSSLLTAHVGISIYEPATGKYWYNYQGDKYFVPASNTKIPTCYAAMKYLGDSLVGLRYEEVGNIFNLFPTGDPTFMHKDYSRQKVYDFLLNIDTSIISYCPVQWESKRYGNGWSWNDYNESYMAERSPFPIFGNIFVLEFDKNDSLTILPDFKTFGAGVTIFSSADINAGLKRLRKELPEKFAIRRSEGGNSFEFVRSSSNFTQQEIPIYNVDIFASQYLHEVLKGTPDQFSCYSKWEYNLAIQHKLKKIYSQPTDSLLKPMMHRSDNFFAEQSLLMVSNERLGVMSDAKIIDTLLKTDFKDLPQRPRWADGSGLSRYNLFTPQDFISILNKMKNEFGMERLKVIFPTGGEGTISSYYKADSNYIFAKTGTLSGVVALSGYLYTRKGKLLIFSALVNNHQASATAVRRTVEKFIHQLRIKN